MLKFCAQIKDSFVTDDITVLILKNIELKVTVEKLKKELVERQELLVKAS